MRLSRRSVLAGGSAAAALGLLDLTAPRAAAQMPIVRYSATSTQGRRMLAIYADAVGKMMRLDQRDPRSWTFQWYTHSFPGQTSIQDIPAMVRRVYGETTSPNAQLALAMWGTCQPHYPTSSGQYLIDNFLPWHRMYVNYLEDIIRVISNQPSFTLPYWDYTNPSYQALPPEFLRPNDALYRALYRSQRNSYSNEGKPITTGRPSSALNTDSMLIRTYGGSRGFCNTLDNGLHGRVHDYTGNGNGMGSVPTAAGDPVFWIHHCNIDRVWASWNRLGNQNPSGDSDWGRTQYTFVNGRGQRVTPTIASVLNLNNLGISYDAYLLPPGRAASGSALLSAAPSTVPSGAVLAKADTVGAAITLADKPVVTTVKPVESLSSLLAAATPNSERAIFLSIGNITSHGGPGIVYDVYLGLPQGAPPTEDYFVGSVGFFALSAGHGHGPGAVSQNLYVTPVLDKLASENRSDELTVTLVPSGKPKDGTAPQIGSLELVAL